MRGQGERAVALSASVALSALALLDACGGKLEKPQVADVTGGSEKQPELPSDLRAILPREPGAFGPSMVEVNGHLDGNEMAKDVERCKSCHKDVVLQWRSSVHGNASLDDHSYLATFDRFRKAAGTKASLFCVGCHMPGLLIDGAANKPISPEDPRAHAGITCEVCHRISGSRAEGNGSFVLEGGVVPNPSPKVPGSREQHIAGFSRAALRTVEVCAGCHRGSLHERLGVKHFMQGGDVVTPHAASGYAGSRLGRIDSRLATKDCIGCHMPKEEALHGDLAADEGTVASHRFVGARSWLAAMLKDDKQLELVGKMLRDKVSLDIPLAVLADGTRVMPARGAEVVPGQRIVLDVVLRNLGVGHLFPGASLDVQDVWLEVTITDRHGRQLAEAGARHEKTGNDPTAHQINAIIADAKGEQLHERQFERFDQVVKSKAIGPRDASVVRYAFDVPKALPKASLPLLVKVRLRHRGASLALQRLSCRVAGSPRGRAFSKAAPRFGNTPLDPCPPQPVLDIAETFVYIGTGASTRPKVAGEHPAWRRYYEHGLALSHDLQERLGEAQISLNRALDELKNGGAAFNRAMVQAAQGRVAAYQGRTAAALEWFDKAEVGAPAHPALAAARGDALSRVWRWREAIKPLTTAAEAAPRDLNAWVKLAIALGSVGDDRAAVLAAQRGLVLYPLQPDLLRIQALSLRSLGHPEAEAAMKAYLSHRGSDSPSTTKIACVDRDERCALERLPVHVHELRPAKR